MSCFYAKDILPKYGYSNDQIKTVCELIMSTQMPISPDNKLEEIICDANFAYLGRVDFIDIMKNQAKEMINFNIVSSEKEWFEKQLGFVKDHEFYTATARVLRGVSKEEQGKSLEELI